MKWISSIVNDEFRKKTWGFVLINAKPLFIEIFEHSANINTMIIDTHSHLNFNAFKEDADEIIKKTLIENIWIINVGSKYETSKIAVEIAERYGQGIYAAIGLHPMFAGAEFVKIKAKPVLPASLGSEHATARSLPSLSSAIKTDLDEGEFLLKEQDFNKEKYLDLAKSKKVVAIGEIGLDYYYKPKTIAKLAQFKEKQKQIFLQQLDLAKELNLPVILHCRMAHDDVIEILKSQKVTGVIHCFTGTWEQAQKYIEMGFYIGINGIIFKFNIDEVIKKVPLDKIVVETDCPYLTPSPAIDLAKADPQGYTRNEPIFIKHTIQKIADLKSISFGEVAEKTTQNAKKLFGLDNSL